MIRITLRLSGEPAWKEPERIRTYQNERFGKLDGETFITELMPLPKPSDDSWPAFWPWPNWDAYASEVIPQRLGLLASLLRVNAPRYVFCYGKGYWQRFKELFPEAEFEMLLDDRFEIAHATKTTVVLTPFFSSRAGMTISPDRSAGDLATVPMNIFQAT